MEIRGRLGKPAISRVEKGEMGIKFLLVAICLIRLHIFFPILHDKKKKKNVIFNL